MKWANNKNSTYYTHSFHPYPAKFTPQVVNKFFNRYCKKGFKILDPFCGSGTTLVESVLNNMDSVGIDLNPIAYIISRAKTEFYTSEEIQAVRDFITDKINYDLFSIPDNNYRITIPDFPNQNHWFQENVSYELSFIKKNIEDITDERIKILLLCAFSKIIVKVSNQDSEVRYTSKSKNHPDGFVIKIFIDTVKNYLQILSNYKYSNNSKAKIYNGDTSEILKIFPNDSFDFIITSPPYINTFDYYLYHKQRMFWLGYDHKNVRKKEIGNHHRIDTKSFDEAKTEYVETMTKIMIELSRIEKPNSKFVMIIGDGIVNATTIDMSKVISEICKCTDFVIEDIESVNLSDVTRSFNKKFSRAPKKEHTITLINNK